MWKTAITTLALLLTPCAVWAQDLDCSADCFEASVFSTENVHLMDADGADPPLLVSEIRWHETESILVVMSGRRADNETLPEERKIQELMVWRMVSREYDVDTRGHILTHGAFNGHEFTALTTIEDTIIVGTQLGSLLLWDLWQEKYLDEVPVSSGEITGIESHPEGEWLIAVVDKAKLFQVHLEQRDVSAIQLSQGSYSKMQALAFSSDGELLAVAADANVAIWDVDTWNRWDSHALSAEHVAGLLFLDDDSQLLALTDESVTRWALVDRTLDLLDEMTPDNSESACHITDGDINIDDSLLVTIDECQQIRAWDLNAGTEIALSHWFHSDRIMPWAAIQFSANGRYLAQASSAWALWYVDE